MARPAERSQTEPNFFQDLVQAVSDHHGQLDIHLDHLTLRLPVLRENVELNGTITLAVHLRDLSEKEKQARVEHELQLIAR